MGNVITEAFLVAQSHLVIAVVGLVIAVASLTGIVLITALLQDKPAKSHIIFFSSTRD